MNTDVSAMLSERERAAVEDTLTGEKVVCSVFAVPERPAERAAKVTLEVLLPPGFPADRRLGVQRYAEAAVKAVAERAGREE
jgi:hypothetical protein